MKVLISKNYGGFTIPYYIMEEYAKKTNKPIYYYLEGYLENGKKFTKLNFLELEEKYQFSLRYKEKDFGDILQAEYSSDNFQEILGEIISHETDYKIENLRTNETLINIVEENMSLMNNDNQNFAKLKVVEIPDDVDWEVEDYDGVEWIAEKHRVWE